MKELKIQVKTYSTDKCEEIVSVIESYLGSESVEHETTGTDTESITDTKLN